jgi:hypothetical protein
MFRHWHAEQLTTAAIGTSLTETRRLYVSNEQHLPDERSTRCVFQTCTNTRDRPACREASWDEQRTCRVYEHMHAGHVYSL